jgi:hypothetical protein
VPTDAAVLAPADVDMDGRPPLVRQDRGRGRLGLNEADAFNIIVSCRNQEEEPRVGDKSASDLYIACVPYVSMHARTKFQLRAYLSIRKRPSSMPFVAGISLAQVRTVAPFKQFGRLF